MSKIIITEDQLLRLRKSVLNENEDSYGNLQPGQYRDCQGVGNIEACVTTVGNLKYQVKGGNFPYHALIYMVTKGDTISTILQKIGKDGYEVKNPMEFNPLLKSDKDIRPNDVLLFDFGV